MKSTKHETEKVILLAIHDKKMMKQHLNQQFKNWNLLLLQAN